MIITIYITIKMVAATLAWQRKRNCINLMNEVKIAWQLKYIKVLNTMDICDQNVHYIMTLRVAWLPGCLPACHARVHIF